MNDRMNDKIQAKWKESFVLGQDCIAYGDGRVVLANTYGVFDPNTNTQKRYWFPHCDTSVAGLEKYDQDLWTEVDIFHGAFEFESQKIVFGDGGMGNEGYVASITPDNQLNWSIFSTFSNPIMKAEIVGRKLICYGETDITLEIDMDNLTSILVIIRED